MQPGKGRLQPLVLLSLLVTTCVGNPLETALHSLAAARAAGNLELAAELAAEARAALPPSERLSDRALWIVGEQGRLALELGRVDEAERYFTEIRDRIEGARGPRHPSLGYSLGELAQIHMRRRDVARARELWERVLALEKDGARAPDGERAFALAGLAVLAREEGRAEEADRLYREAITQGSTTSERFWPIRQDYAALLRELGREEEAERVEAAVGGAPLTSAHYLWHVLSWRFGLDPFDERYASRFADERMPLRVYVPLPPAGTFAGLEAALVRDAVRDATEVWRDVVQPGVPSFVFADERPGTDIRVEWVEGLPGREIGRAARAGQGEQRTITIKLATRWDPRVGAPLEALPAVARHEVGHALGLWGHSPDSADLMSSGDYRPGRAPVALPTARDRETLRRLYGLAPGATVSRYKAR